MHKINNSLIVFFVSVFILASCSSNTKEAKNETKQKPEKKISVPDFNADSAYNFVNEQVKFGPRVPKSKAHKKCASYLVGEMKRFGARVIEQKAKMKAFDDTFLPINNIISSFYPDKKKRLVFFSHWDSRPFSDHDPDPANYNKPILGANDGASGVGVLMEIGRLLSTVDQKPDVGIDLIFLDAEDYGTPDHLNLPYKEDTWCLGSQYWSANMHEPAYYPLYGVLLDMVGAPQATFYKERFSMHYAPGIVEKTWATARNIGYGNYFIDQDGGMITDDHVYVNRIAGIPTIDIIQHDPSTESSFGAYWHTQNDDMSNVDRNTLKAVGQTLVQLIFQE